MKSILLKIDDKLLDETEVHVRELKTSRNSYIRQALEKYNQMLERSNLEKQFAYESQMIREGSAAVNDEFTNTSGDGLNDEY